MVARTKKAGLALAILAALTLALTAAPRRAPAQGQLAYFLTLRSGVQNAEGSGDTLFEDFEAEHGPFTGTRDVETEGLEFDLITFPSQDYGVGLGIEYHQYFKVFFFQDPTGALPSSRITLKGRALLYTLKFYRRFDSFWPYLGLGTGNYFMNFSEGGMVRFFEASTEVYHGRVGVRIPIGSWSLVLEYGRTHAPITIQTRPNLPVLELGGTYRSVGIGVEF